MSQQPGLILRFLSLILFLLAAAVTAVLAVLGYNAAIWLLENGNLQGHGELLILTATPSLAALLSAPFWLALRWMRR